MGVDLVQSKNTTCRRHDTAKTDAHLALNNNHSCTNKTSLTLGLSPYTYLLC